MRLFVAIELPENRSSELRPVTLDSDCAAPALTSRHPLATFVAQLTAAYLARSRFRVRSSAQADVSYTAASCLTPPKRPKLDRSV
jgi:hypothetical protein